MGVVHLHCLSCSGVGVGTKTVVVFFVFLNLASFFFSAEFSLFLCVASPDTMLPPAKKQRVEAIRPCVFAVADTCMLTVSFLDFFSVMKVRQLSQSALEACDRLCEQGPPPPGALVSVSSLSWSQQVACDRTVAAIANSGIVPSWLCYLSLPVSRMLHFVRIGVRSPAAFTRLTLPPWNDRVADWVAELTDDKVLYQACGECDLAVLKLLGGQPFNLGGNLATTELALAVSRACECGHVDVLRVLGDPTGPWRLGPSEIRWGSRYSLFKLLCNHNCHELLREVGNPEGPWKVGLGDLTLASPWASASLLVWALLSACSRNDAPTLDALSDPSGPWKAHGSLLQPDEASYLLQFVADKPAMKQLLCDPLGPWKLGHTRD